MAKTITLELTYDELSCLHGWGNFVKFTPGEDTFDERDERVHLKVYEALHPWLAPCLGRPDLVAERGEV